MMKKVPKVTERALKEIREKVNEAIEVAYNTDNPDHLAKLCDEVVDELADRQPHLYNFLMEINKGHLAHMNGMLLVTHLNLYVTMLLKSIYIQEEYDNLEDMFNLGEKDV
jgi:hypothetical protein